MIVCKRFSTGISEASLRRSCGRERVCLCSFQKAPICRCLRAAPWHGGYQYWWPCKLLFQNTSSLNLNVFILRVCSQAGKMTQWIECLCPASMRIYRQAEWTCLECRATWLTGIAQATSSQLNRRPCFGKFSGGNWEKHRMSTWGHHANTDMHWTHAWAWPHRFKYLPTPRRTTHTRDQS